MLQLGRCKRGRRAAVIQTVQGSLWPLQASLLPSRNSRTLLRKMGAAPSQTAHALMPLFQKPVSCVTAARGGVLTH